MDPTPWLMALSLTGKRQQRLADFFSDTVIKIVYAKDNNGMFQHLVLRSSSKYFFLMLEF